MDTTKVTKVWKVVCKCGELEHWVSPFQGFEYKAHEYVYPTYQHNKKFYTNTKRVPLNEGFLHFFKNECDALDFIQRKYADALESWYWNFNRFTIFGLCECIIPCGAVAYEGVFKCKCGGTYVEFDSVCGTGAWVENIRKIEKDNKKVEEKDS